MSAKSVSILRHGRCLGTFPVEQGTKLFEILRETYGEDSLTAYERDPGDALHDVQRMLKMLGERYTQIVNRDRTGLSPAASTASTMSRPNPFPLPVINQTFAIY